jgi:hypothetical protein
VVEHGVLVHGVLHLRHLGQIVDLKALGGGAVEEVANLQDDGEDGVEGEGGAEDLEALLEVAQRLADLLLQGDKVQLEGPEPQPRLEAGYGTVKWR